MDGLGPFMIQVVFVLKQPLVANVICTGRVAVAMMDGTVAIVPFFKQSVVPTVVMISPTLTKWDRSADP